VYPLPADDPHKAKVIIWIWNEDHLVYLVEKEIPF